MEPLHENPTLKKMRALQEGLQSGRITQAEYDRKWRALMVQLQSLADRERAIIKKWAIDSRKVRDEAEYTRLCRHYHDGIGDSFHHFLTSIYHDASFLTLNEKMLDDARLLELRFGGKILSPEEAARQAEAEQHAEHEAADDGKASP